MCTASSYMLNNPPPLSVTECKAHIGSFAGIGSFTSLNFKVSLLPQSWGLTARHAWSSHFSCWQNLPEVRVSVKLLHSKLILSDWVTRLWHWRIFSKHPNSTHLRTYLVPGRWTFVTPLNKTKDPLTALTTQLKFTQERGAGASAGSCKCQAMGFPACSEMRAGDASPHSKVWFILNSGFLGYFWCWIDRKYICALALFLFFTCTGLSAAPPPSLSLSSLPRLLVIWTAITQLSVSCMAERTGC